MKRFFPSIALLLSGCFVNIDEETLAKGKRMIQPNSYPAATRFAFVNQCSVGADLETCECLFAGIEKNMHYQDYLVAEKYMLKTGHAPGNLMSVIMVEAEKCVMTTVQ